MKTGWNTGSGLVVGAGLGIAIGAAMDNVGVGIAIGSGIGLVIGAAVEAYEQRKKPTDKPTPK